MTNLIFSSHGYLNVTIIKQNQKHFMFLFRGHDLYALLAKKEKNKSKNPNLLQY